MAVSEPVPVQAQGDADPQSLPETLPITPALVREVTAKVYTLLRNDLRIEHERGHRVAIIHRRGGR